jgi:DHA3 family tetracycline resistance protein-like MFS transporter
MSLPAFRAADPARTYYAFRGGWSFFSALAFTLNMVYFVKDVGLSPLQMVLVGTTLEIACFAFEVPTAIVADLYSRRLSIIIGFVLVGGGLLLQGLIPAFAAVLAAQVLWGLGYTFTSGADQAWITDEVGEDRVA